ncbi:MAG: NADH-quinone oxidoreductase subunit J [Alicyclobacillaceae bacterium]|nr:NADH-quinone oxidoreductase subunit J [Alicyclobacillaceae bacterium]
MLGLAWTPPMIAFLVISLLILVCAIMAISFRKVIYMALAIGGVFLGCAAVYILLGAEFVGAAQILIYAGAITILIMFAIMLTNHEAEEPPAAWSVRNIAAAVGCVLLGVTLYAVIRSQSWPHGAAGADVNQGQSNPVAVGLALFQHYTVPFELVSLLLIVALVGAVILAQERKEDE